MNESLTVGWIVVILSNLLFYLIMANSLCLSVGCKLHHIRTYQTWQAPSDNIKVVNMTFLYICNTVSFNESCWVPWMKEVNRYWLEHRCNWDKDAFGTQIQFMSVTVPFTWLVLLQVTIIFDNHGHVTLSCLWCHQFV